jgi:CBS domain containing-hemolysin-like protein
MVSIVVIIALMIATVVSFWSSLVEATYLTVRPFSLNSAAKAGSWSATKALQIIDEKTKLVSVTTLVDTIANVVLASSIGLILSDIFGPIGWVYSSVAGSLVIMTMLYLLPKAIGIENSLRMALRLAPSSYTLLNILSPVAVPLTTFAKNLSYRIVGKPSYQDADLVDEFEDVVTLLEKGGHIEPDAGRLLRAALASSKSTAADALTPIDEIIHVPSTASILDALRLMGRANHPRMPVYDEQRKDYIGAVTFRSLSKAISRGLLSEPVTEYMIQPAKVSKEEKAVSVIERMQDAATTIAFVYEGEKIMGVITITDIIEQILGVKV